MPSEFDLIDRYFARKTPQAVLVGPATIAPCWRRRQEWNWPSPPICWSPERTSSRIPIPGSWDGRHYVNVSDFAAMGRARRKALLVGELPAADESWIVAFAEGFFAQQLPGVTVSISSAAIPRVGRLACA